MPPVFAAIGFALAGAFGATVGIATAVFIGEVVVFSAVSIGLGFIEKALVHPPKSGAPGGMTAKQSRGVTVRQPITPWRVIYGIVGGLGGVITYIATTGANNEYLNLVITIAGHQIQSVDNIRFDGVIVPRGGGGFCNAGKFNLMAWFGVNLGSSAQTAITGNGSWPFPAAWDANHRQRGRAHIFVQLKWDANVYSNGVPNITFDVHGHNLIFDPRTSTTGFSQNAALCLREYLSNTSYGLKATAGEINDAATIASANNCDDAIALAAGGTEARYTCNGEFDTSQAVATTITDLLSAMAGDLVFIGGQWNIFSGMYRAATVTLTDSDARDKMVVNARLSKRDTFNGVKGLFISPQKAWKPTDFPAWQNATYVAEDGGEVIWKDIDLPFTTSFATAQRLAKIQLESARRQVSVIYKAKLTGYQVQPMDTMQLTHARAGFAWTNKTFKCTQAQLVPENDAQGNPVLGVDLLLREFDANIFNWAAEEQAHSTALTTTVGDPQTGIMAQSQLEPVVRAAGSSSIVGTSPITATDAGASATVTLTPPFSIQVGATSVGYTGAVTNFTGKAYSKYYYLYVNDPGMLGGTPAGGYQIATDLETVVADPQNVLIGWVLTPAAGAGGTGGSGGGGAGGFCPCLEQWLRADLQVKKAHKDDEVDAAVYGDAPSSERIKIAGYELTKKEVPCYRLVTANGVETEQSWDTPIDQPNKDSASGERNFVKACNAKGFQMLTDIDGEIAWSEIVESLYIGRRRVAKISLRGRSFAHGSDPKRRGFTHNIHKV